MVGLKNKLIFTGWLSSVFACYATQDLALIDNLIKDYVQESVAQFYEHQADFTVQVGNIDSRLKLEDCTAPLIPEIEFGRVNQHFLTVKVACETPKKWAIRVPVKVHLYKEIVLASHPIQKDQVISQHDLKYVRTDVSQVSNGYYVSPDELIGLVATKPISDNAIIMHHMVKPPVLVHRGETVKLVVKAPGLTIEGTGIAQSDGMKGQTIRIKNSRSSRMVEATVQEPGVAVVSL
ncbi:MAG: flagellar basal body P-ring formation chaperone FlgA [Candidatus Berkiella sp.]